MQNKNLYERLALIDSRSKTPDGEELVETLLSCEQFHLERIVSTGQVTPEGEWFDQDKDEWVILLSGAATLRFEDQKEPVQMRPGDYLSIVRHRRHRVEWTDPTQPSVWIALHFNSDGKC